MRTEKLLIGAWLMSFALSAGAQSDAKRSTYSLRLNQTLHGTSDAGKIADRSPYPLNKRYEHFTPEEKAVLRSFNEGMPEADEPPFPVAGMANIMADVSLVAASYGVEGELTIFVAVNERGDATGVKLIRYPNMDLAKSVAFILVKAKYKPATCNARPCALEFPFRFLVRVQ